MKKSSIFVIIVAFIVSIFIISNFGLSVRTDHMKSYIKSIDITHCLLMDGKRVDYDWVGSGENKRKIARIDFSQQEGSIGLYINYNVERGSERAVFPADVAEATIRPARVHSVSRADEMVGVGIPDYVRDIAVNVRAPVVEPAAVCEYGF